MNGFVVKIEGNGTDEVIGSVGVGKMEGRGPGEAGLAVKMEGNGGAGADGVEKMEGSGGAGADGVEKMEGNGGAGADGIGKGRFPPKNFVFTVDAWIVFRTSVDVALGNDKKGTAVGVEKSAKVGILNGIGVRAGTGVGLLKIDPDEIGANVKIDLGTDVGRGDGSDVGVGVGSGVDSTGAGACVGLTVLTILPASPSSSSGEVLAFSISFNSFMS